MIEKAIEYRQTLTRVQLIAALMSLYKEEKYALKKSVGSIGGAVSQEFLYYNQKNDSYTRLKWNIVIELKERNNIMLKITDLKIDPTSLGDVFLLAEISPSYEYKDGERTTNINGYKYSVALPQLRFEKISIKVPLNKKNQPLFDINSENPIPTGVKVGFKNIEVKPYFSAGNINFTASADDVFLVKEWNNDKK